MSEIRNGYLNDLTGQRFGKLKVLSRIRKNKKSYYNCICDCDNEIQTIVTSLTSGSKTCCGCTKIRRKYSEIKKGDIFGNFEFIEHTGYILDNKGHKRKTCKAGCICGKVIEKRIDAIVNKTQKSCGCINELRKSRIKYTHCKYCGTELTSENKYKEKAHCVTCHRIYSIYNGMRSRCYNEQNNRYYCYGAKGISICEEWLNDIDNFVMWALTNGYKEGLTIDRKNNDKGYCPDNCKWADYTAQARNKTTTKLCMTDAREIRCKYTNGTTVIDLAKEYKCSVSMVYCIISNQNWKEELPTVKQCPVNNVQ